MIDVYVSARRNTAAAREFFERALRAHRRPRVVVTDKARALLAVIDELLVGVGHDTSRYSSSRIEWTTVG